MGIIRAYLVIPLLYRRKKLECDFINVNESNALKIPFWCKLNMTIKEAAAYSNIGINKIEELLKQPQCDFVLYVGNKKLVKRKEFESYISKSLEI